MTVLASSLSERTARAARWRFAGSFTSALIQFALSVLLARLLTPSDFGVVALAAVVLGIAKPIGDVGLGSAIVQRSGLTDRHVRAAFTCALLAGAAAAALLALVAPLAATMLEDARVTPLLRVLSLTLAFRGIGVVAEALLGRHLDFKQLFIIESVSALVGFGAVAVTLALLGYGGWSLVWGNVIQALLSSAAHLLVVRHSVRPLLAMRELGELVPFGVGSALGGWVNYLALNGDNVVVGRWLGAASLGLYGRAYALMSLPFTYTSGIISGVLFPAFSHVQDDPARLRRGYLLATQLTAFVAGPSMAALAISAPHVIPTIYGSQWAGAVPPLQILCVAGYFRALYHLGGVVIRSTGRIYAELALQVVYASLVILGALAAVRGGLQWVAGAVAVAILYMFVATTHVALKASGTSWPDYLRVHRRALAVTAMTCAAAILVRVLLEASGATRSVVAFGIAAGALVPWVFGTLWSLRQPDMDALQPLLPAWLRTKASTK